MYNAIERKSKMFYKWTLSDYLEVFRDRRIYLHEQFKDGALGNIFPANVTVAEWRSRDIFCTRNKKNHYLIFTM